jgi:hypothetical protein
MVITRKGGKVVAIPLAPRTADPAHRDALRPGHDTRLAWFSRIPGDCGPGNVLVYS